MNAPQRLNTLSKQQLIYRVMALESANEKCSDAIAAAVQAEREACAKISEEIGHAPKFRDGRPADWIQITAAIRARSEEK